jgi:hypothetical protein
VQDLRYGENPHQGAAFYRERDPQPGSLAAARQLQGKALSFNNIADTDAALDCVRQFAGTACVIVKHANPCGVAVGDSCLAAYERAYATDPESAFGGIIAFNRELDESTARAIIGAAVRRGHHRPGGQRRGGRRPRRARSQRARPRDGRHRTATPVAGTTSASAAACWCRTGTRR